MDKRLKNVLFSATVNHGTVSESEGVSEGVSERVSEDTTTTTTTTTTGDVSVSYNELKRMIVEMGGKVSATVHKKVDYVIASRGAVDVATQRVRKADKFQIPVVKVEFIQDVYMKKVQPDTIKSYTYSTDDISKCIKAYKDSSSGAPAGAPVTSNDSESGNDEKEKKMKKKRKIDDVTTTVSTYKTPSFLSKEVFECACICHDRGESSCSWCVSAHSSDNVCGDVAIDTVSKSNCDVPPTTTRDSKSDPPKKKTKHSKNKKKRKEHEEEPK
jgi:hypothetical protein